MTGTSRLYEVTRRFVYKVLTNVRTVQFEATMTVTPGLTYRHGVPVDARGLDRLQSQARLGLPTRVGAAVMRMLRL